MGNQGGVDEAIHKAVSFALQHKDMEERKAREAESQHHIAKQYQELNKHLDSTADKYDDFDEVVRGEALCIHLTCVMNPDTTRAIQVLYESA